MDVVGDESRIATMSKEKQAPAGKPVNIKVKARLDLVTAKLKQQESEANRCTVSNCKFISDGLRLSQEVELLQKQNVALRAENELLRTWLDDRTGITAS
jgi:hypothetical protein